MDIIIVEKFQALQNAFLDNFFSFVSKFGEAIPFIIIFFLLYWCVNIKSAMKFLCVFLSGIPLNEGIKHAFKRPRPYTVSNNIVNKYGSSGYAFPSGHSVSATLSFGGQWMQTKQIAPRNLNIFNAIMNCLIIILVMLSRIYLGQHYLSDVICGFLFAILWLIVADKIYNFFGESDHKALLFVAPVALLVALFTSNPFTVNAELTKLYIVCGLLMGVSLGYFIDRSFVKMPYIKNKLFIFLKGIIGVVITLISLFVLLAISKYLFVCLVGYCIFGIITTAGCSTLFKLIYKKFFKESKI